MNRSNAFAQLSGVLPGPLGLGAIANSNIAKLFGLENHQEYLTVDELPALIEAERAAHQATRAQLAEAQHKLAQFESIPGLARVAKKRSDLRRRLGAHLAKQIDSDIDLQLEEVEKEIDSVIREFESRAAAIGSRRKRLTSPFLSELPHDSIVQSTISKVINDRSMTEGYMDA